jgi:hypothetical protein
MKLRVIIFFYCGVLLPLFTVAQNAPVTTAATFTGAMPGLIAVPITVDGFTNIGAISLTIDYDYSVMHFSQGTPNPMLVPFNCADIDLGNGNHRVTMGWFGAGKTLPDGSTIMTLVFTFIGGSSSLQWFDDGGSCEYADASYNVLNDIPTSTYYINGTVCGTLNPPGIISGSSSVCIGQSGVFYSVASVPGATGYVWTAPPGAIITAGGNSTWVYMDYPVGSASGYVTAAAVNLCGTGPSSELYVTVNLLPLANAGNDTTIPYGTSTTLHAADGGSGSFGYHWYPEFLLIDPNVQDPVTIQLVSTNVFTVLVTNLTTLCQNSDAVTVAVSGGPLNLNPVAEPASLCRGSSSQLLANAGGGSGNYTYSWTCAPPGNPPWSSNLANPVVTPDTTTVYDLTVWDGFSSATGSVTITVTPVPGTPVINLNGTGLASDTCCGNQWYKDGLPIPGADGQFYEVSENGTYFDIVSAGNCISDTSNYIVLLTIGLDELKQEAGILLFPNPARGVLHIRTAGITQPWTHFMIINTSGSVVKTFYCPDAADPEDMSLDISGLAPGIYVLMVTGENDLPLRKLFLIM